MLEGIDVYYLLEKGVQLRTWIATGGTFFKPGLDSPYPLAQDDYALLKRCDGVTALPEPHQGEQGKRLAHFARAGLIRPCVCGEAPLEPFQVLECNNRFFPRMYWEVTSRCPYNCLHCFNASDEARSNEEFSLEESMRFLDEAASCGVRNWSLTGGDPLMHPHFREIITGIVQRGMIVKEVVTTGLLLDDDMLEFLRQTCPDVSLRLSFDGIGYHNWMRCSNGAQEAALAAIQRCVSHGFCTHVNMNVNQKNKAAILPSIRLLDKMGVNRIRVIRTSESPRWAKLAGDASMSIESYYEFALELLEHIKREEFNAIERFDIWQFAGILPKEKIFKCFAAGCPEGKYRETYPVCKLWRARISVCASGQIRPCMPISGVLEKKGVHFGNVKTEALEGMLREGSYLALATMTVGERLRNNATCCACEYKKRCVGGCPTLALLITDNLENPDPLKCVFFKQGYYQRLQEVMEGFGEVM